MGGLRRLRETIQWDLPAPPRRIRSLLRQERRFHARRGEFSDDWLPFPILVLPLLFVYAAAFAVVFPGFLASAAWLGNDADVCDPKQVGEGELVIDACRWVAERLTADGVRELPGFVAVVAWVGTALALAVGLGFLLTHVRSAAHRRSTWRDALWYEYVSWRDGRGLRTWGGIADLTLLRRLVRLLWRPRTGDPEERLKHARRWAWANEAMAQAFVIGLVLLGSVCAALLMWRSGTLSAERPVLWDEAAGALDAAPFRFLYDWGLAWPLLYEEAATRLQDGRVQPPAGSAGWTARLVARELPRALREPG